MHIIVEKNALLKPLQLIGNIVDRKQVLPILSNVLIESIDENTISLTGTDSESRFTTHAPAKIPQGEHIAITTSAKKLTDLCKSLPDNSTLELISEKNNLLIKCGNSRFTLATLPASEFPIIKNPHVELELSIEEAMFKSLLEKTCFAMAQQDVRYYLNGVLLDIHPNLIRSIATDGHRLALSEIKLPNNTGNKQILIPRKSVIELLRLLEKSNSYINLIVSSNHICIKTEAFSFSSKLIEGKFPDYQSAIPKNGTKIIILNKNYIQQALTRVSILTHEKYNAIRIEISEELKKISANNAENEEAEEVLNIDYTGSPFETGVNVIYLQEAIAAIQSTDIKLSFTDSDSSILVEPNSENDHSLCVIMPMRL